MLRSSYSGRHGERSGRSGICFCKKRSDPERFCRLASARMERMGTRGVGFIFPLSLNDRVSQTLRGLVAVWFRLSTAPRPRRPRSQKQPRCTRKDCGQGQHRHGLLGKVAQADDCPVGPKPDISITLAFFCLNHTHLCRLLHSLCFEAPARHFRPSSIEPSPESGCAPDREFEPGGSGVHEIGNQVDSWTRTQSGRGRRAAVHSRHHRALSLFRPNAGGTPRRITRAHLSAEMRSSAYVRADGHRQRLCLAQAEVMDRGQSEL